MFLRIEDVDEINMLRSIARSEYASSFSRDDPSSSRLERLRIHEFEDNSDDEMPNPSEHGRRRNLVRQAEQDEPETLSGLSLQPRSASAGIRGRTRISNMEIRLSGYRHEKMRSSTRSGELTEDQVSGLVYDPDFDCYYNPQDDQYYRLEPTTKSEA